MRHFAISAGNTICEFFENERLVCVETTRRHFHVHQILFADMVLSQSNIESKDGKKHYDSGSQSEEMQKLNRVFAGWHGASALVNLVGIGFTVWYGFSLAERIV